VSEAEANADVETRVEQLARDTDLTWVVAALTLDRDKILAHWLEITADQAFHANRREQAVADHIPRLFDALVAFLRASAPRWIDSSAPMDDPDVLAAARAHANMRSEQGLSPADVVVEFRLLRQEIWYALRRHIPDNIPTSDVIGAEMLVNDALDGAITIGQLAISEQIESVREDFFATTVHDVRQPITVIKGAAQLGLRVLAREQPNLELVAGELRRIESSVDHMAEQLQALIDASRVALGRLDLTPEPVDLTVLVHSALARLSGESADRVTITVTGTNTTGTWDVARIERVLDNLLSNAVKYSPQDSLITVTVRDEGSHVTLSVRDQGIGIAADDLPRLFRRYNRARSAGEHHIDGLGLGLYLCRGIVEAHGGAIRAESPGPDLGTVVHVLLPRGMSARGQA
jgi:signal transduction histidine kinase